MLFLIGLACTADKTDPTKDYAALQKDLDMNKSLWASKAITHYRFDCVLSAFLPHAGIWYTVEVDNDQVVSIIVKDTQEVVNPSDFLWIETFEGTFATVQAAISGKANSIKVTYNKGQGFIEYYYIDLSAAIADDENSLTVTNMEIL